MFPITARATKDGDWWLVIVPELEGTFGQAASRNDVERVAREVAGLTLDVAEEEIDIQEIIFDE